MTEETKLKSKRGGARPGAGRKPQANSKKLRDEFFDNLNNKQEVIDLAKMWQEYKTIALDKARRGETEDVQWIFSRIMPVPKEQELTVNQDITSNGNSLGVMFNITAAELLQHSKEQK